MDSVELHHKDRSLTAQGQADVALDFHFCALLHGQWLSRSLGAWYYDNLRRGFFFSLLTWLPVSPWLILQEALS